MARLKEMYQSEIVDAMIKKFGYKNIMEVPKLDKIVITYVSATKIRILAMKANLSINYL